MRLIRSLLPSLLLVGASIVHAASSWGFDEAILSISATQGRGSKPTYEDKLSDHVPLSNPVTFRSTEKLKILLVATEDGKPKRPHQAFLMVRDQDTGLESSFMFQTKDNGKGLLEFTQDDLPVQFIQSTRPLRVTLIIASFGTSESFSNHVMDLELLFDADAAKPTIEKPFRYGKLPEINHIFKPDPKSGPYLVSIFFTMAIGACVSILLGVWSLLDANLDHLPKAISTAPVSHILFFGSIVAMEGIFVMYYWTWTLFEMLPLAGVVGLISFVSGSKALSEVQARREASLR